MKDRNSCGSLALGPRVDCGSVLYDTDGDLTYWWLKHAFWSITMVRHILVNQLAGGESRTYIDRPLGPRLLIQRPAIKSGLEERGWAYCDPRIYNGAARWGEFRAVLRQEEESRWG